ncbi:uncharacterized protein PV09_00616 [Verruconis gallopava]|uniref:tRNA-dihydrouridine(47) synthase [NAD(P)(+)] n=1 Tax=Verruconis gallopava TaxID=253628 RepID=A0A0D2APP3_9PEZI|nr:uncharacterized protein PV09_00616 [Verruconis gallopava]KIW08663.1 hypothetical protein PV09_00616 [Verruconis gallopava]
MSQLPDQTAPSVGYETVDSRPSKRPRMENTTENESAHKTNIEDSIKEVKEIRTLKGVAPIKAEFLIHQKSKVEPESDARAANGTGSNYDTVPRANCQNGDRDGVSIKDGDKSVGNELMNEQEGQNNNNNKGKGDEKKNNRKNRETGQNKKRQYGSWGDKIQLCPSRQLSSEFSPRECSHGEKCKFEHSLRRYLKEGKQEIPPDDHLTPEYDYRFKVCPVWEENGYCPAGWKCRYYESHSQEIEHEDGKKELILIEDVERMKKAGVDENTKAVGTRVYNVIDTKDKIDLERRRVKLDRSDQYAKWLTDSFNPRQAKAYNSAKRSNEATGKTDGNRKATADEAENNDIEMHDCESKEDTRASFTEPPFRASEKRKLYYGPDTPVLAPLTTQGNLPFRRLCVDLGAQVTWSEMAMSLPLIQGQKQEWALVKAHESEITPPRLKGDNIVKDYDNAKDLKFGVQIAANKFWPAFKATEALAKYCPKLRAIDLNCGCPIDLVFNSGAGSALLDSQAKLEKMLRGMNALSGEIPIQVKIRMGVKDNIPTAGSLVDRLVLGGQTAQDEGLGPCGVAAITLHGRSRQQRYTREANWDYIHSIGAMIKDLNAKRDAITDTAREGDSRDRANGGRVYFIGNGDIFSYEDYWDHIENANVDSCMIARGALIKPWIFEEIEQRKHIDKSADERFEYIRTFCRYGMDTWGSDEIGVGTTRRFLLEWLSFTHRYVPLGLLERLPAKINERPPPYFGRNDKETLLASNNYKDWIKISEMFLGPANKDFNFTPKHKSNAYESIEAEG